MMNLINITEQEITLANDEILVIYEALKRSTNYFEGNERAEELTKDFAELVNNIKWQNEVDKEALKYLK